MTFIVLILSSSLYAGDWRVTVVDDQTEYPISDALIFLMTRRYQPNPGGTTSLWRKEINRKTDSKGEVIIQDSDFFHPSRSGRANEVALYICKVGYWPSKDKLMAKMIFISFLKPSDFQHEYRLKKATPEEYMSAKYFRSISQCPESKEKKQFTEKFFLAEAQRFQNNILSNNPETIVNALKEISDSPIMTIGDSYTENVLALTGKILTHKDPAVRKAACRLLSDYRASSLSPEIMQNLLLLLEDSSSDVQTAAGEAVRIHGSEAVTYFKSSILNLLNRPETGMQKLAIQTISKYSEFQRSERKHKGGDPDIISHLRKLLYHSSDEEQIKTLLSTLGNLGYEGYFEDLESFYTHPNPRIQETVIVLMRFETSFLERKKTLSYFVQGLQSPDKEVRYVSVIGIDRLGDKSQIECLENLLITEKEPSLQKTIKETISRLEKKK